MITFLITFILVFAAASIGLVAGAAMASGRHEDECRACRREARRAAFNESESFGGSDE